MAGNKAVFERAHLGCFTAAAIHCIGTARVEPTAGRRVCWTWQFTRQKRLFFKAYGRIRLGYGVDEKARVRMQRRGVNLGRGADLA